MGRAVEISMKFQMKRAVENKLKNIESKFMLRQSERTIAVKFEMWRAVELRLTDKAVPVRVVKIDGTLKLLPRENTIATGANKCDSERCAKHLSVDPFNGNEAIVIGNENFK